MKQRQLFQKPMLLLSFLLVASFCFSQTATTQWTRGFRGPTDGEIIYASQAVDAAGNVYVAGTDEDGRAYRVVKYNTAGNVLWQQTYSGPDFGDYATAIAVDSAGNVYVTGKSSTGYNNETGVTAYDYATIKYDAAGNELWVKRYDGGEVDFPKSLAVDAAGNVYVTGYSGTASFDYATVKYSAAGAELWVKRYNGPGNFDDVANALTVDGSGNVYVTGWSTGTSSSNSGRDYATIKYNTAGTELWVRRSHYVGGDEAYALAVDAAGNVYVTGKSTGVYNNYDYATLKYDASGNVLWSSRYNGPGNGDDEATDLALDATGNVYVTGAVKNNRNSNDYDYATIKYSPAGAELRVRRYNGPGNNSDRARSLIVDAAGNVYVTGQSIGYGTGYDFATVKYDAAGAQSWVKRYDGYGESDDYAAAVGVDGSGNVYVTGLSVGNNDGDFYVYTNTIKYAETQHSTVSSITLINADTNADIRQLQDGDTINLAGLATLTLNIRANTAPAVVGSVVFNLIGAETRNQTESIVPYALFGDNNRGDYFAWTPTNGAYTLKVTPYSSKAGGGTAGTPLTIHFTVTRQVVSSLVLVNARTDQDIKALQNGDVIDLASLPTRNLNIRAVVHPDTVGSVVFNLNNELIVRENLAPYAVGGDINGNYRSWTLPIGNHTLTATPYALANGTGIQGKGYSVTFTVVDMATTVRANAATLEQKAVVDVAQNLRASPNPFTSQTTISFSVPVSGRTLLEVYDLNGRIVERLYEAHAEAGKTFRVPFNSKGLAAGVYMARLSTNKQVQSYKLVLVR